MNVPKIALIILGFIMFAGGFYCMMAPADTFLALAPIFGAFMIVDGIGSIVSWSHRRKLGQTSTFDLIAAILSVVLGLIMLVSSLAQVIFYNMFLAIMVLWLFAVGVVRIISALQIRKLGLDGWGLILVSGILLILCGIFGLLNPFSLGVAVGIMIGLSIFASGISLITMGLAL